MPGTVSEAPVVPPHRPRPYPLPVVDHPLDPARVEHLWQQATEQGTPLVERHGDEYTVTFLYRDGAAADVVLHLNKLTDYHDLRQSVLRRVPGTDIWHLTYRMPATWRASYALGPLTEPARGPDGAPPDRAYWRRLRGRAVADPLNRTPLHPPLSVVSLPGAPVQSWLARRDGVTPGVRSIHRIQSGYVDNTRTVWVSAPAGTHHVDLPVIVLLDGDVWGGHDALGGTVDNLVAEGAIPPSLVLMVDPVDVATRTRELACNPSFVDFLAGWLLPWAAERWPITSDPTRTVVAGQSLGGLTAAYAALRAPGRFGAVLSQSGSYWYAGERLTRDLGETPTLPVRWYVEVGTREWDLVEPTRRFTAALRANGYDVTHREYDGGHDIACWRGSLADGLLTLLGTPGSGETG